MMTPIAAIATTLSAMINARFDFFALGSAWAAGAAAKGSAAAGVGAAGSVGNAGTANAGTANAAALGKGDAGICGAGGICGDDGICGDAGACGDGIARPGSGGSEAAATLGIDGIPNPPAGGGAEGGAAGTSRRRNNFVKSPVGRLAGDGAA
ncbi:MAG: hypothetical protein ABI442_09950 [Gemmatimonadaceae bacterium]